MVDVFSYNIFMFYCHPSVDSKTRIDFCVAYFRK